ncbi:(R,R)-butanediol dehydrogenase / meso-butanediol dehydrogenase / diacetyl reductase [Faunimonas pinastri]|uniref:(R,R)-butanediol dehydrogenase / meso-butanediol dehydrogenase / diacetyl reductase n=1 Tax=Faunimonas pinastri TaxID=1855383 RepID=A0A1H8ZD56_9HYPH|nr:alcohol dehydrogenase catalytic domain-containing protein [Faunimonas pinastri]SEP62097.1 (R,R)-butanediol dehydrogenase / meso-butanediol dehydrogenase / diacetyl reductase [Faunimonas pinastri]
MRAVRFHGPGDLRLEDIPRPHALGPEDVRVKVLAAGICGSDLHNYRTGMWVSHLPVTPGHEFAGEVIETGSGVAGLRRGDIVVADSRANCGTCVHCREGRGNVCLNMGFVGEVCDGGFAEEAVLPARRLLPAPLGLPPEIAAMGEPLGVALHVVRRLDPARGQPILIVGGGTIGGLTALLLTELGFGPVLLAERNEARAKLLADVAGAEIVPFERDALAERCGEAVPRFAVEATGSLDVLRTLLATVSAGGRIAMVGTFHGEGMLDPNLIVEREIDLRGCSVYRDEQAEAISMLPRLAARLSRLAEDPIGLEDVPAAYERLIRGESPALKTLIRP